MPAPWRPPAPAASPPRALPVCRNGWLNAYDRSPGTTGERLITVLLAQDVLALSERLRHVWAGMGRLASLAVLWIHEGDPCASALFFQGFALLRPEVLRGTTGDYRADILGLVKVAADLEPGAPDLMALLDVLHDHLRLRPTDLCLTGTDLAGFTGESEDRARAIVHDLDGRLLREAVNDARIATGQGPSLPDVVRRRL